MPASLRPAASTFFEKPGLRDSGTARTSITAFDAGRLERRDQLRLGRAFIADGEDAPGHSGRWQTASMLIPSGSSTKAP